MSFFVLCKHRSVQASDKVEVALIEMLELVSANCRKREQTVLDKTLSIYRKEGLWLSLR